MYIKYIMDHPALGKSKKTCAIVYSVDQIDVSLHATLAQVAPVLNNENTYQYTMVLILTRLELLEMLPSLPSNVKITYTKTVTQVCDEYISCEYDYYMLINQQGSHVLDNKAHYILSDQLKLMSTGIHFATPLLDIVDSTIMTVSKLRIFSPIGLILSRQSDTILKCPVVELLQRGCNIACQLPCYCNINFIKFIDSLTAGQIKLHRIIIPGSHDLHPQHYITVPRTSEVEWDWVDHIISHPELHDVSRDHQIVAREHMLKLEGDFHSGINIGRTRYVKYDLNKLVCYGLCNQLYGLINAIIISHYTHTYPVVNNFYPQYNSRNCVPLDSVIDITHLNTFLSQTNLRTQVITAKLAVDWQTRYFHAAEYDSKAQGAPSALHTLARHRYDNREYVDSGNPFLLKGFRTTPLEMPQRYFKTLLSNIRFNPTFHTIAQSCRSILGLTGSYHVVHLRLEDDIATYLFVYNSPGGFDAYAEDLYQRYLTYFTKNYNKNDTIFIATGLGKQPNRMNSALDRLRILYPNMIINKDWRTVVTDDTVGLSPIGPGREYDAIIDLLLAREGTDFLGYQASTYSLTLDIIYSERGLVSHLLTE